MKLYELISKITLIKKPKHARASRGFDISYDNAEDNWDFIRKVIVNNTVALDNSGNSNL